MMFCKNCGSQLPEGSAFCAECGTPVNNPQDIVSQPVQQPQYQQPVQQPQYQQPVQQPQHQQPVQQPQFQQPVQQPQYQQPVQQPQYQQPVQQQQPQQSVQQPQYQQPVQQPQFQQPVQQPQFQQPVQQPQFQQPVQQPQYQQPVQQPQFQQPVQQPQYQQPQYQQTQYGQTIQGGMDYASQGSAPLEYTPFPLEPGTPTITFEWGGAHIVLSILFLNPFFNYVNFALNGMQVTLPKQLLLKDKFRIKVPIVSEYNKFEVWNSNFVTDLISKKPWPLAHQKWEVNLDPTQSYVLEIKRPLLVVWFNSFMIGGFRLKDLNGNVLLEK